MTRKLLLLFLLIPTLLVAADATIPDSQLLLMKNDSPLVAFRILFRNGSANDPAGKEGLAALTSSMIDQASTKTNDYQKILELLYPMAASYSAQVDKEMTVVYGVTHKDNLTAYYNLLRDAILSPAFKQDDFDRVKTDQLNYVAKSLRFNDDEELAKETLNWGIFKNHPYGHPDAGLVSSIQKLTLDDVKNYYAANYTRKDITIGIAGDYPDSLVAQVKKDFSALPAGETTGELKLPTPTVSDWNVILVDKQTPATGFTFGFPIPLTRADDDYYPLMVAASWMGQHRSSVGHLFQVIREVRGLNYGDYAYIEYFPFGGRYFQPLPNVARHQQIFEIWIRPVQNQNRQFALRMAARELQKLIDNGLTKEDFELTRNFLLNYSVNLAQSNSEMLGYSLDDRFYGLKSPYLDTVRTRLNTMTVDDVNKAIKKYLSSTNMVVTIVGQDAATFAKAIEDNTPSPITYESPKPDAVTQEDKQIEAYSLPVKPDHVTVIPADKIFQ